MLFFSKALFVAYGPWGPRTPSPPNPARGYENFVRVMVAAIIFVTGYQIFTGNAGIFSYPLKKIGKPDDEVEEETKPAATEEQVSK